jgi:Glycosyl transferase family 2
MPPLLEIMILTKPERHEFLEQLLSCLEPQISKLGVRKFDQVDILVRKDDWKEPPFLGVGGKRDIIRQKATGEYICWFDDDDLPAPDYIATLLPLLDGVDYVGFQLYVTINKRYIGPTIHSLEYSGWTDNYTDPAHYRDISHLNPMRRELAMLKPFSGPIGEDHRWADSMRGLVKTQHFADKVLYYYFAREGKNDAVDAHDPWRLDWLNRLRP